MFASISTMFRFLLTAAIILATLCAIKCGTAFFAAFTVPSIAVFAAVSNMTFVAYRARNDPIMSTIPDPSYSYLLIAKRLLSVYNHNDAVKRAVILAYSLHVNCFNLSNAYNI